MNQKFNEFNQVFEAALSHYSNGGFREGTALTIKPAFFKSEYFRKHYSGAEPFVKFLKQLSTNEVLFFIKKVMGGGPNQDVKDAEENSGAGDSYLVLHTDPRVVEWPTEFNEFTVPADYEYVEVKDYGINLPPVQGAPNKYERVDTFGHGPKVYKMESKLDNRSQDSQLPTKHTSLPHTSPAKDAKYSIKK